MRHKKYRSKRLNKPQRTVTQRVVTKKLLQPITLPEAPPIFARLDDRLINLRLIKHVKRGHPNAYLSTGPYRSPEKRAELAEAGVAIYLLGENPRWVWFEGLTVDDVEKAFEKALKE